MLLLLPLQDLLRRGPKIYRSKNHSEASPLFRLASSRAAGGRGPQGALNLSCRQPSKQMEKRSSSLQHRQRQQEEQQDEADPVIVLRLDQGGAKAHGDYQCTECGWRKANTRKSTAQSHVKRTHEGRSCRIRRENPKSLKEDPHAVATRHRVQRYRAREKEARERAERLGAHGGGWPLMVSTKGTIQLCRVHVTPGRGKWVVTGACDTIAADGFKLSMSVASINARALSGWLGAPQASDLVLPSLDVSITAFEHGSMNRQASGSAAGFVALVIAMGGRLKDGKVIMTGEVDLRGKVVTVGSVREKVLTCMKEGADLVVVPGEDLETLNKEGWASDKERAFVEASVKGVAHVAGLLQLTLTNFGAADVEEAAAAMDGPHVGVCRCIGLLKRDNVFDFEAQCCWVYPGQQDTVMTGNLSDMSKDAIVCMKNLLHSHLPTIARTYGAAAPDGKATLSLMRHGADLHVHLSHAWQPVDCSYVMATIYMAMASLVLGRRPPESVLVFGMVKINGDLSATKWEILKENVETWCLFGIRRVIVGAGIQVSAEVREYARKRLKKDKRPRVEFVEAGSILDALALVLPPEQG